MKKIKKPSDMSRKNTKTYAGFEGFCYIGGEYYTDTAQIHIKDEKDVRRLATYLTKLADWLEQKKAAEVVAGKKECVYCETCGDCLVCHDECYCKLKESDNEAQPTGGNNG